MNKTREYSEQEILQDLIERYPMLSEVEKDIQEAFEILCEAYNNDKKLLVVGNGGSASDAEHIVGELMKSFNYPRKISNEDKQNLKACFGADGEVLASKLEGALPAISLPSLMSLHTACINDNDSDVVYAQMVHGLGQAGDILLAISTSGNSENIVSASMVARSKGMKIIGMTNTTGGKLKSICDINIGVPAIKTHEVQEYHLPVYHALCAMLETYFFECK